MSGSRKVLVVAIIAVAGAGAVWLGLARRHAHFDAEAGWRSLADRHAHSGAAPPAPDFAEAFREASNYRSFIVSALAAAQRGDRDAEYFLSAALAYCDETN